MQKKYQRTKKNFKTAKSSWMDIAKKTGIKPKQFKASHTMKLWIWVRK